MELAMQTTASVPGAGAMPAADEGERHRFGFTGEGGEYFRIWIVNILLSIVTLYVYSAWAKVRTQRYFAGNTTLDGAAFEYHARPLQILAGRVVAVFLLLALTFAGQAYPVVGIGALVLLPLILPWVVLRSTMFNARMTSYRNVRLDFRGGAGRMYLYTLVLPLAPLLVTVASIALAYASLGGAEGAASNTLMASLAPYVGREQAVLTVLLTFVGLPGVLVSLALTPWLHRRLAGFFADNYRYGGAPFAARPSTRRFYAIYGQSLLLAIGLFGVIASLSGAVAWAPVVAAALPGWLSFGIGAERFGGFMVLAATLLVYPAMLLVTAFFRAGIRNHLYESTVVDERVRLESTVRTWALWRLMFGNLALLYLTAGIATPWVKVRLAEFFALNTAVRTPDGLHAVVDDVQARQGALGEEIGEAFDMELDVGF